MACRGGAPVIVAALVAPAIAAVAAVAALLVPGGQLLWWAVSATRAATEAATEVATPWACCCRRAEPAGGTAAPGHGEEGRGREGGLNNRTYEIMPPKDHRMHSNSKHVILPRCQLSTTSSCI